MRFLPAISIFLLLTRWDHADASDKTNIRKQRLVERHINRGNEDNKECRPLTTCRAVKCDAPECPSTSAAYSKRQLLHSPTTTTVTTTTATASDHHKNDDDDNNCQKKCHVTHPSPPKRRFATFNTSLNRNGSGDLINDLKKEGGDEQAKNIAAMIQIVRPEVLLLKEFDYDDDGKALRYFKKHYLEVSQDGNTPIEYEDDFLSPVNTGVLSGWDYNNDGKVELPNDGYGFGYHPGQYGMALLSMHKIEKRNVRTFQNFLWMDMPCAVLPYNGTTGVSFYDPLKCESGESELNTFRLSSKSHWDIPIKMDDEIYHVLAAHPTPPVFDDGDFCASERTKLVDWNGKRNHDEIRLWADYISPNKADSSYIYDDDGVYGGIENPEEAKFVIMGDYNADPVDGDSYEYAAKFFTNNPMVNNCQIPESRGAAEYYEDDDGGCGIKSYRTNTFGIRGDYTLPSANICIADAGVFWPVKDDPQSQYLYLQDKRDTTDHRMVWIDVGRFE